MIGKCLVICLLVVFAFGATPARGQEQDEQSLRALIEDVAAKVTPALVRIHVVTTEYSDGRELKHEATGSGVVISPEGHVVTNHHVAGEATQVSCTFADKTELDAEIVGTDPLTDVTVLKLKSEPDRSFPVAPFGDSSQVRVGNRVLAMGSPLALSQSVTMGIVSNTEMVMPRWIPEWERTMETGEDVGSLVLWIGHDAEIYGGNSGGPLVNMNGEVIGLNEIRMGLSGAIPGNLVKEVAAELMANGKIRRSWIGIQVQPRLKHAKDARGILIGGTISGSPAADAGIESGDLLVKIGEHPVDVRFPEELPGFNQLVAGLTIGSPVEVVVVRNGQEKSLSLTPVEREKSKPQEHELKRWGITASNLSLIMAKRMKRDTTEGVLVTSVRQGGPATDAKPQIGPYDVIRSINGTPVKTVEELIALTGALTEGKKELVPVLTEYERKTEKFVTVAKIGIKEIPDPSVEVKKAWLPAATQVATRDIAETLGRTDLKGFRVTQVYPNSTAEKAGLKVGDFIIAVDEQPLTANAPEHYEELAALIRQYKVGTTANLKVLRDGNELTVPVELVQAPKMSREMKQYRDEAFEFTVRDISFFDKVTEKWPESQQGALVSEVTPGGWAAVGLLNVGDLVTAVDDAAISDTDALEAVMKTIPAKKPASVTLRVIRGIQTVFVELEPKWENNE